MKVFLVDDSLLIRQRLARMLLRVAGVQIVGEAFQPRDAASEIQRLKPDLVVLDVQLLNGTGMEVLQTIKKMEPTPVVIVVTNYPEYRNKYLAAGADYFFDKSTEFHRIPLVLGKLTKDGTSQSSAFAALK